MKLISAAAILSLTAAFNAAVAETASDVTKAANQAVKDYLPFADTSDFENARRGLIATLDDPVVKNEAGDTVYDASIYAFIDGEAPDTTNPSLWRQSQLNAIAGLFEVTDGIYQFRGYDLANVSFIRGKTGWIVVDPLTSTETAAAGLGLLQQKVEDLPVSAIIITHSHADHFGGVRGVLDEARYARGDLPVIAPEDFFIESINENLMAGNTMSRRAGYMYGNVLDKSPTGSLGSGLGTTTAAGTFTIVEPTIEISASTIAGDAPEIRTVDGVRMEFWYTPGAEAPAELMFWLPDYNALMQAEEITRNLHNLYTLRGAKVRNGLLWSKYIQDVIARYGDRVEVSFGSHHWPTWGNEQILAFWRGQRDTYRYIHDQTLRLANQGLTMLEIAEEIELPESLATQFANRGYYGTVNHNAKAQYQLYFGWFSGNPSELNELPPVEEGRKFVEYVGGAEAVIEKARADYEAGEYRFAATALNHLVFAEPDNQNAKNLLADVLTQMGYQAESGPWRNFYLSGATELREGVRPIVAPNTVSADVVRNLGLETYLDYLGVRLNGPKAAQVGDLAFTLAMPDVDQVVAIRVENGALNYIIGDIAGDVRTTVILDRATLDAINLGETTVEQAATDGSLRVQGDATPFATFVSLLDKFDPLFPIVTP